VVCGVCILTRLYGLIIVVCWCLHTYQTVRSQCCGMLVSAYLPDCTVSVLWYAGVCVPTRLYGLSIVVCWRLHTYQTARSQNGRRSISNVIYNEESL